jgi:hypothetical protein
MRNSFRPRSMNMRLFSPPRSCTLYFLCGKISHILNIHKLHTHKKTTTSIQKEEKNEYPLYIYSTVFSAGLADTNDARLDLGTKKGQPAWPRRPLFSAVRSGVRTAQIRRSPVFLQKSPRTLEK